MGTFQNCAQIFAPSTAVKDGPPVQSDSSYSISVNGVWKSACFSPISNSSLYMMDRIAHTIQITLGPNSSILTIDLHTWNQADCSEPRVRIEIVYQSQMYAESSSGGLVSLSSGMAKVHVIGDEGANMWRSWGGSCGSTPELAADGEAVYDLTSDCLRPLAAEMKIRWAQEGSSLRFSLIGVGDLNDPQSTSDVPYSILNN